MLKAITRGSALALTFAAGLLAGSQTALAIEPSVKWISPDKALVLFTDPAFKKFPSKHVVFTDMWQREEYALFQGDGAQAEIIYEAADETDTIALNYDLTVERGVMTWNIARNHTVTWGEKGQIGGPLGAYFYERFKLIDLNRDCVGFSTEWDQRSDDPQIRNTKVLFGYYCNAPAKPLSERQIVGVIDNIWIRGITARSDARFSPVTPSGPVADRPGALAFARNGTGNTGNAAFPLDMAEFFNDVDGDSDRQLN